MPKQKWRALVYGALWGLVLGSLYRELANLHRIQPGNPLFEYLEGLMAFTYPEALWSSALAVGLVTWAYVGLLAGPVKDAMRLGSVLKVLFWQVFAFVFILGQLGNLSKFLDGPVENVLDGLEIGGYLLVFSIGYVPVLVPIAYLSQALFGRILRWDAMLFRVEDRLAEPASEGGG